MQTVDDGGYARERSGDGLPAAGVLARWFLLLGRLRRVAIEACVIDGERTLIHRRGLRDTDPQAFGELEALAARNAFRLREDRRRQERAVPSERRRLWPLLSFAAAAVVPLAMAEATDPGGTAAEAPIPEITVYGRRAQPGRERRTYRIADGKRFLDDPLGDVERILTIAEETRSRGDKRRVRVRGLKLPADYVGSFIDRFDRPVPAQCGGGRFSYYEGDGFAALGYDDGSGEVVLDVLAGGGPFAGPRLWGPYDQVLNANTRMKLVFGNGSGDGMGMLNASYEIGLMPQLEASQRDFYGERYVRAVERVSECRNDVPVVRAGDGASTNEAS